MGTNEQHVETEGFRLSPQQERLWLTGGAAHAFNSCCVVELTGELDEARLRAALAALVDRHEILRSTFAPQPGVRIPAQVVNDRLPPAWDTRRVPPDLLDANALAEIRLGEASLPVDLERGPLVRGLLLRVAPDRGTLVVTVPALCADGSSLVVLLHELGHLYDEPEASLAEPLQYPDYAEWRRALGAGGDESLLSGRSYWQARHSAQHLPPLLFGRTDSDGQRLPESVRVPIGAIVAASLTRAAQARRATPALFLEACWHALAARLTGVSEIELGGLLDGRHHPELAGAIGLFAQYAPVQSRVEGVTTFAEVLEQVRRSRVDAESRQDDRSLENDSPVVAFSCVEHGAPARIGSVDAVVRALHARLEPHALLLACRLGNETLDAELEYDPGAYNLDDVKQIAASFAALVGHAVADPGAGASRLALLGEDERERLLVGLNRTEAPIPEACIHELFEDQVRQIPERIAVAAGGRQLTYAQLNTRANEIAGHLNALGVRRENAVGLCLDRSCEMIAALIGILKAGGCYVPLNFEHPPARLASQLEQTGSHAVVTREELRDRFSDLPVEVVCVESNDAAVEPATNPPSVNEPDDLVYVMYTSGSTGLPKGVAVTHRNLVNYTTDMLPKLGADDTRGTSFAVVSAISTDLGNTCVFPSLLSGGTLHLVSPEVAMQGALFAEYLATNPVDVLKITPSHLRTLMATAGRGSVLPTRCLVLGGEAASWELVESIRQESTCRILNHYGPTETTVGSCTFEVGPEAGSGLAPTVPTGRPIANTRVYVLDEQLEPVPPGVPGELCIGGTGVSRGYVSRPTETSERFVTDPFASEAGARMYRTGDRVRLLRDDSIEFLGRDDLQVKIRGYRVEPGEVEAVLGTHGGVRQAAIVTAATGEPRLLGFVVAAEDVSADELRAHMQASLPEYMIPAELALVPELPLTPGGKVDRASLAIGALLGAAREAAYVAPRDELELELVEIWAEVLGVDRIGVLDDFFELGGHSLSATQVIARARRQFGVEVPFQVIFATPTVAGIADAIRTLEVSEHTEGEVDGLAGELAQLTEEEARLLLAEEPEVE